MRELIKVIPVRDSQGDELQIFEVREREQRRLFGSIRYTRKVTRLKLDCGMQVITAGRNTFVIPATGERLTRIA